MSSFIKNLLSIVLIVMFINIAVPAQETVAAFKGAQVTGIAISNKGRIFANFPRWRKDIPFSVVEVAADGSYKPYPNKEWNSWNEESKPIDKKFVSVQAMLAHDNKLYVIETANPRFAGVIAVPKVYVFDLDTDELIKTYEFTADSYRKNSYVNDLRIDDKRDIAYFTDSGEPGIIVLDLKSGASKRYLDNHPATTAEFHQLTFPNGVWKGTVHSDGLAFDAKKDVLYFHALTGYTLYEIKVKDLLKEKYGKMKKYKTGAPDGMILDERGRLYLADLENNRIQYFTPDRKIIKTLVEGERVRWADTFDIYQGFLYYTNSRINEATGDIGSMEFTINKVKLPDDRKLK